MQRFKNILLLASNVAEFSETLERSVDLAECNQAQLDGFVTPVTI